MYETNIEKKYSKNILKCYVRKRTFFKQVKEKYSVYKSRFLRVESGKWKKDEGKMWERRKKERKKERGKREEKGL